MVSLSDPPHVRKRGLDSALLHISMITNTGILSGILGSTFLTCMEEDSSSIPSEGPEIYYALYLPGILYPSLYDRPALPKRI